MRSINKAALLATAGLLAIGATGCSSKPEFESPADLRAAALNAGIDCVAQNDYQAPIVAPDRVTIECAPGLVLVHTADLSEQELWRNAWYEAYRGNLNGYNEISEPERELTFTVGKGFSAYAYYEEDRQGVQTLAAERGGDTVTLTAQQVADLGEKSSWNEVKKIYGS